MRKVTNCDGCFSFFYCPLLLFSNVKGHSRPFSFSLTLACPPSRIDFHLTSFVIRYYFGKISPLSEPTIELQPAPRLNRFRSINLQYWSQCGHFGIIIFIISFLRVYKSDRPARVYVQKPLRRCSVAIRKHFFHQTSLNFFFLNNRIFFRSLL